MMLGRTREKLCSLILCSSLLGQIDPWIFEQSKTWAQVAESARLPHDAVVVEVAPGGKPKVGLGLQRYGFHGTLYIIEPEPESLRSTVKQYKEILPEAKIIGLNSRLAEASLRLPKNVDAVFANHPLDDMLIEKSLNHSQFNDFFGHVYGNSPDITRRIWENFRHNSKALEASFRGVAADWGQLILKTHPHVLAIAQYESYYFTNHNIKWPDTLALQSLRQIEKLAGNQFGYQKIPLVKSRLLDPDRWLLVEDPLNSFEHSNALYIH